LRKPAQTSLRSTRIDFRKSRKSRKSRKFTRHATCGSPPRGAGSASAAHALRGGSAETAEVPKPRKVPEERASDEGLIFMQKPAQTCRNPPGHSASSRCARLAIRYRTRLIKDLELPS
jgi:hypothetical protein